MAVALIDRWKMKVVMMRSNKMSKNALFRKMSSRGGGEPVVFPYLNKRSESQSTFCLQRPIRKCLCLWPVPLEGGGNCGRRTLLLCQK